MNNIFENLAVTISTFGVTVLGKVLIAIAVFIIGKKLINWLLKLIVGMCEKGKVDKGVESFASSFIKAALYIVLFVSIAGYLGIETTSFITLIGSIGVTVGLALQGSLSNLAGGVLILILKPFKVGDYIISGSNEGTVSSIEIFHTSIRTGDNRTIILPNGALANSNIINVTHETTRRVDINVPISYDADIREVKKILTSIYEKSAYADKSKEPDIIVNSFDDSSIGIMFRVWTNTENYWSLRGELMENIKNDFDANSISIPYNQLDVFIKNK